MKIRIINENDWEKVYDLDKSIIRIGSQVSCDIQLRDPGIQPLMIQIVRSGGSDVHYVARFFADNIMMTRGNQVFPVTQLNPYDLMDGDKIGLGRFRMILSLEDEKVRVRTSTHMQAEIFFSKRELSLEHPINGMLTLTNVGTDKPCQFSMKIAGIPDDCVQSAPLPFLYPGASSTVGFIISHLRTRPGPGFHTISVTISAPDEYFGETLEFNQDIYVNPVFDNDFILEDDSAKLSGFNKKQARQQSKKEPVLPAPDIPDTRRLNIDEAMTDDEKPDNTPVRIVGSNDSGQNVFDDDEEEPDVAYKSSRKKKPVIVVHHENENAFEEDDPGDDPSVNQASAAENESAAKQDDTETETKGENPEKAASTDGEPPKKKRVKRKKEPFTLQSDTVIVPSETKEKADEVKREAAASTDPAAEEPKEKPKTSKKKVKKKKAEEPSAQISGTEGVSGTSDNQSDVQTLEPSDLPANTENIINPFRSGIESLPELPEIREQDDGQKPEFPDLSENITNRDEIIHENTESENLLPEISAAADEPAAGKTDDIQAADTANTESDPLIVLPAAMKEPEEMLPDDHFKVVNSPEPITEAVQPEVTDEEKEPEEMLPDDHIKVVNSPEPITEAIQPEVTDEEKEPEEQVKNTAEADSGIQFTVFSGTEDFDDYLNYPIEDPQPAASQPEPQIKVVKGGGFDE